MISWRVFFFQLLIGVATAKYFNEDDMHLLQRRLMETVVAGTAIELQERIDNVLSSQTSDVTIELTSDIILSSNYISIQRATAEVRAFELIMDGKGFFKIDGSGSTRCFWIYFGNQILFKTITFKNLIIRNGFSADTFGGGAIYCFHANVLFSDCVLSSCTSVRDHVQTTHTSVCLISFNNSFLLLRSKVSDGGALFLSMSVVTFNSCVLDSNTAAGVRIPFLLIWLQIDCILFLNYDLS